MNNNSGYQRKVIREVMGRAKYKKCSCKGKLTEEICVHRIDYITAENKTIKG